MSNTWVFVFKFFIYVYVYDVEEKYIWSGRRMQGEIMLEILLLCNECDACGGMHSVKIIWMV